MEAHACIASTQELRQEDCCEFEETLGDGVRPCLRKKKLYVL